jgi:hypothetical protein
MPSFRAKRRKWEARRKRLFSYHLGYFDTKEEAERAEKEFDKYDPPGVGGGVAGDKKKRKRCSECKRLV